MIKKGIVIDPHTNFRVEYECNYEVKRIDYMYYKTWRNGSKVHDLIPIAYIYPIESRTMVEALLQTLKNAKDTFNKIQADIFYKELPKLRD